jgi:hemerythrin superfamily protein
MPAATQSAKEKRAKTSAKSAAKTTKSKKTTTSRAAPKDAIALLQADHREVEGWFSQFEKARGDARKAELAQKICLALKVHTQIEEEIFYPISREFLDDESIVDEAVVEHAAAKDLIAEIEQMQPGDELYDAKVKVLSEQIEHHVEEEEKEYFPEVKKTDMDLKAVGEQMADRKKVLMASMAGEPGKRLQ